MAWGTQRGVSQQGCPPKVMKRCRRRLFWREHISVRDVSGNVTATCRKTNMQGAWWFIWRANKILGPVKALSSESYSVEAEKGGNGHEHRSLAVCQNCRRGQLREADERMFRIVSNCDHCRTFYHGLQALVCSLIVVSLGDWSMFVLIRRANRPSLINSETLLDSCFPLLYLFLACHSATC